MGASVSKNARAFVQRGANKVAQAGKPVVPLPPKPGQPKVPSTAANPGNFMRGEGQPDIRDIEQERFLRRENNSVQMSIPRDGVHPEMSSDLLKFINDVGPTKKTVDEDLTNQARGKMPQSGQIGEKTDAPKKVRRERMVMPLMGLDESFTATRNTNFNHSRSSDLEETKFGMNIFDMYGMISRKATGSDAIKPAETSRLDQSEQEMQENVAKYAELPLVLKDSDGNLLGIYPSQFDPDIRNVTIQSDDKLKLVIKDVIDAANDRASKMGEHKERQRLRREER